MPSALRSLVAPALCFSLATLGGCGEESPDPAPGPGTRPEQTPDTIGSKTPTGEDTEAGVGAPTEQPQGTAKTAQTSEPSSPDSTTPDETAPSSSETPRVEQPKPIEQPDQNPLQATIKVEQRAKPVEERTALPPNAVVRLFDAFGNPIQAASGLYRVAGGPPLPIRSGNVSLRVEGTQRVVFSIDGCTTVATEIAAGLNALNVRPAPVILFTIEDALPRIEGGVWQLVGKVRDPNAVAGPALRAVPIATGQPTQWPLRDQGLDFECSLIPDPRVARTKPLPSISVAVRGPADLDAQLARAQPGSSVRLQLDAEAIAAARQLAR